MSKFQFFCIPNSERKEFTFLDMDSDSFLEEKKQLLNMGFEVEDDTVFAETSEEAVTKFRSNYTYALQEYTNSTHGGGLATFIIESYKEITYRLKTRKDKF